MASSSSSSSTTHQLKKYDVFISFRGADVRVGFLSHLHEALRRNLINAFVDENLDKGEEISASLLDIIEKCYISIIIFSENYAQSRWCLEELLKINECKKTMGQKVLPVFYNVDPTQVQELTGSFGDAIAKHFEEFKDSVESWSQALRETAGLAGLVSHNTMPESKLIEEIVNQISKKLNDVFSDDAYDEGLIGIDSRVEDAKKLLCLGPIDVRVLGIWGMGGIGKSTIAGRLFDRISGEFDIKCFVTDIRERYKNGGPDGVRQEVLLQLFGRETYDAGIPIMLSSSIIRKRLFRKKVLIALDDVSDIEQIELSIGKTAIYGAGSRFIFTSRDKQLLRNMDAEIYVVEKLNDYEASWLFRFHAFKHAVSGKAYILLSKRVVRYAQGNPLALKVLGSNLYGRSLEEWEDEMDKLEVTSDYKIQRILKFSYDGLSNFEKEIFLDIACFFKGEKRDAVEKMLEVAGSKIGISRLIDKSLVSEENCRLLIHDLVQQMGMDIIFEENQQGKHRRLWHPNDIYYILTSAEGIQVKGISLDMPRIREVELSPTAFQKLYRLRWLKFYCPEPHESRVYIPEGLTNLPYELRLLHWCQYPMKCLPLSFCAEKLVKIIITGSKLEELWDGVQHLGNLKVLNLSNSKYLMRIPDLSSATNLDVLKLRGCVSLVEIPSTIEYLSKLYQLDLSYCRRLCKLPSFLHLKNLAILFLFGCSKIREFPEIPPNCMGSLGLNETAIEQVPSTIGSFSCLTKLWLASSLRLKTLPESICQLNSLQLLNIDHCINLHNLPGNLGNLASLKLLVASCSGIRELPSSLCRLKKLAHLSVEKCVYLQKLPEMLGNLESLEVLVLDGSGIKELPDSLCFLKKLRHLSVEKCVNLQKLPENLGNLESLQLLVAGGSGMTELPDSLCSLEQLTSLSFAKCVNLHNLPEKIGNLESLEVLVVCGSGIKCLPDSFYRLRRIRRLSVEKCVNLRYLPENLGNLEYLEEIFAPSSGLEGLPESICSLKYLRVVNIDKCVNLHELPSNFGNLESLERLTAAGAGIRHPSSSFNQLNKLRTLSFRGCEGLIIPTLTGFPHLGIVNLDWCGLSEFPKSICFIASLKKLYVGGNNFERIPDSIKHLSQLVSLHLSDSRRLKYLPELPLLWKLCLNNCICLESGSLLQLQRIHVLEIGNCINLDLNNCSAIVEHVLGRHWASREALLLPGSEVPQWMEYQNNSGSSLSLSLREVEQIKSMCFCAVLDPKVLHPSHGAKIGCTVHVINEYGNDQYRFVSNWKIKVDFSSEHVFFRQFLASIQLNRSLNSSVTIEIFVEDISKTRIQNAILKCGVHLQTKNESPLKTH